MARASREMIGAPVVNTAIGGYRQRSGVAPGRTDAADRQAQDIDHRAQRDRYFPRRSRAFRGAQALFHARKTASSNIIRRRRWSARNQSQVCGRARLYCARLLGYSTIADFVLSKLSFDFWYGDSKADLSARAQSDEVPVTCALLERVKKQADAWASVRCCSCSITARCIVEEDEPPDSTQLVNECARKAGYEVVDQYPSLRAIALADETEFRSYYGFYENGEFGHMSSKGNAQSAKLLAEQLKGGASGAVGVEILVFSRVREMRRMLKIPLTFPIAPHGLLPQAGEDDVSDSKP